MDGICPFIQPHQLSTWPASMWQLAQVPVPKELTVKEELIVGTCDTGYCLVRRKWQKRRQQ